MEFSFFKTKSRSGIIRANQVAEKLGGKINPIDGYQNDICIYIKKFPEVEKFPAKSYFDILDNPWCIKLIDKYPNLNIIVSSLSGKEYLKKILHKNNIIFIPQHHCNYERFIREKRSVKVVGVIGCRQGSIQYNCSELKERLKKIGVELKIEHKYKTREDVVNFYKKIDIQICWRPDYGLNMVQNGMTHLKNTLKLVNACSFGIPTIALPEFSWVRELNNYFIHVNFIKDLVNQINILKDNEGMYNDYATKGIKIAEKYHIDNIIKLYKLL